MDLKKMINKLYLYIFAYEFEHEVSTFNENSWKFHFVRLLFYGLNKNNHMRMIVQSSIVFFNTALQSINYLPCKFNGGRLGLMWSIKKLANLGIVSLPETHMELTKNVLQQYTSYYRNSPFQYNPQDEIYPIGLIMTSLSSSNDTIQRYSWDESTIHRIRDCERILTVNMPPFNNPSNLTAGILHSMMYFMVKAKEKNIFPKKAIELIEVIQGLAYNKSQSKNVDQLILNYFIGNDWHMNICKIPENEFIDLLSEIGWYSFVYQMPNLFSDVYKYIIAQHYQLEDDISNSQIHTILGLCFGCISKKIEMRDENRI